MIVGILSDTHGNVPRTATAAALMQVYGVKTVFHCGDIGSEAVLLELVEAFDPSGTPIHAVLGNVDTWDDAVRHFPDTAAVRLHGTFGDLTLSDRRIALVHGHEAHRLQHAMACGAYDYVFTGHTHCIEDRRQGRTRLVNPGAVHRAGDPTIAILDLASDTLQHISLLDLPTV